jgi:hypothetical protein
MPSETTPRPAPGRRTWLVIAAVTAIAVAGNLAWQRIHRPPGDPSPDAVAASTYKALLQQLPFRFHLPNVDVSSYRLLGENGDLTNGRTNLMSVDYEERSGDILELTEGTPRWMLPVFTGRRSLGRVVIGGRVWTKYRHSDPILATTLPDGLHVIVRNGAGWGDLARFAARVPAR